MVAMGEHRRRDGGASEVMMFPSSGCVGPGRHGGETLRRGSGSFDDSGPKAPRLAYLDTNWRLGHETLLGGVGWSREREVPHEDVAGLHGDQLLELGLVQPLPGPVELEVGRWDHLGELVALQSLRLPKL